MKAHHGRGDSLPIVELSQTRQSSPLTIKPEALGLPLSLQSPPSQSQLQARSLTLQLSPRLAVDVADSPRRSAPHEEIGTVII